MLKVPFSYLLVAVPVVRYCYLKQVEKGAIESDRGIVEIIHLSGGCSKMFRCKARKKPNREAYIDIR